MSVGKNKRWIGRSQASVFKQTYPTVLLKRTDEIGLQQMHIMNELAKEAKTKFIGFIGSDDWLHPQYTETLMEIWKYKSSFPISGEMILSVASYVFLVKDDKPFGLLERLSGSGGIFDKELFIKLGGFDELPMGGDETFLKRAREMGYHTLCVPKPLYFYRLHVGQVSKTEIDLKRFGIE
jgi:GT2 family glycosyltransferase